MTTDGVEYSYLSGSHLVSKIDYKDGANTLASAVYSYDPDADLPTEVKNKWPNAQDPNDPNTIVSRYEYDYDNLWRPKWVVRESTTPDRAFAKNHHDKFTSYSDRNERTQSKRYDNTSPPAETSPDTNYDRRYWYDTAGNPIKHKRGTDPNMPATYNALNLCTSVGDPNDPDAEFSYDDDHNLTVGRLYKYTYDAENRLIEMEPDKDPKDLTGDDRKYVFDYDYLGRRARSRVYAWDTQQEQWDPTPDEDQRFMYHGRQRILAVDGNGDVEQQLAWGPFPFFDDCWPNRFSRLVYFLALRDATTPTDYIAFHDGAGNLCQLVDRADGSLDAKYDYTGRSRYIPCDLEDPNALPDCYNCMPCAWEYNLAGDNSFVSVCVCGGPRSCSRSGHPGTGCAATGCGWGPDLDPGGSGGIAGYPWYYELVPGDEYPDPACPGGACEPLQRRREKSCEEQRRDLMRKPGVQKYIKELGEKCRVEIVCVKCPAGMRGGYTSRPEEGETPQPPPGTQVPPGGIIYLCKGRQLTEADLIHELIHAWEWCNTYGPKSGTGYDPKAKPKTPEEIACWEVRARNCSGEFPGDDADKWRDVLDGCKRSLKLWCEQANKMYTPPPCPDLSDDTLENMCNHAYSTGCWRCDKLPDRK